jgi:hypothetical protein
MVIVGFVFITLYALVPYEAVQGVKAPAGTASAAIPEATKHRALVATYGKLPLAFEANRGQTDGQVKFLSRGPGYTLFLTPSEAVLSLRRPDEKGHALRVKLLGAEPDPQITGRDRLPGVSNYFIGRDRSKWRRNVPRYAKVGYQGVYPGIDLVFYGTNQRRMEYDFVVAPGADPGAIALGFEGAERLELDSAGDLVVHMAGGEVRFLKPVVYQEQDGARRTVEGRYTVTSENRVGFKVAAYDRTKPLIIDPVLAYSTYLGGTDIENGRGLAVDAQGSAYVTGDTRSADFPVSPGAAQEVHAGGTQDVFVTKFTPDGGDIVYSTYVGGSGQDFGLGGIAVDGAGHAYVVADTRSTDFPTTWGAFREDGKGPAVVKLLPDGSDIAYSTFLGSTSGAARGVALRPGCPDAFRDPCLVYVTGDVRGAKSIETTDNAFKVESGGKGTDPFLSVIDPRGAGDDDLFYGTHFGGGEAVLVEFATAIAVDAQGKAYVAGVTSAHDFPATAGAFDQSCGDDLDDSDCRGVDVGVTAIAISFDAGQIVEQLVIRNVIADGAEESTERYFINLTGTSGPVSLSAEDGADVSAQGLIVDAQGPLTAWVGNATGIEGADPDLKFFIGLNRPASQEVTVFYQTLNGTAMAGSDYQAAMGSVTFEVDPDTGLTGTLKGVDIKTFDDGEDESVYETFVFELTGVTPLADVELAPLANSAEGRIFDNDGGVGEPLVVAISDSAVLEGGQAQFEARLNRPAPQNTTISFELVHDTTSPGMGRSDAFVAKFDPFIAKGADTLVYATFVGGHSDDGASGIVVDSLGRAHLTGSTTSSDDPATTEEDEGFPITAFAYDPNLRGTQDAFVTILNETGSGLVYSTYLGGDSTDSATGIALDPNGLVHVTGTTGSADDLDTTELDEGFPMTPDAIQPQNAGRTDVFAVMLNPADGNEFPLDDIVFSTYLGGSGEDRGGGIAADGEGGVYLAGITMSTNFTTTPGAFQEEDGTALCDALRGLNKIVCRSQSPVWDAFAAKIALDAPPPSDGEEVAITAFDTAERVRLGVRQCIGSCTKSVTFSIANLGGVPADVNFFVISDTPDGVTFSRCDGFATFLGGTSKDFVCTVNYETDREKFIFTDPVTIMLEIVPSIDTDPNNNERSITVKVSDTRK